MSSRSAVLASLLVAALGCAPGKDGRAAAEITAGESANGSTVALATGQPLALRLRSAGDGGYGDWILASPPDARVLKLVRAAHEPPPATTPGLLGDFGTDVFAFVAVGRGRTRLEATATRPWNGETVTFDLTVDVR